MMFTLHSKDNYVINNRRIIGMEAQLIPTDITERHKGYLPFIQKKITVYKRTALNTNEEPCSDDGYDLLKVCLDSYYEDLLNCSLPWNKNGDSISMNQQKRNCNKPEDLKILESKAQELHNFNQTTLYKELNCLMPCTTLEYTLQDWWKSSHECNFTDCHDLIILGFFVFDGSLHQTKEVWLYSYSNFIADFGGYLGLLLGASAIAGYQWIKTGVKKAKKNINSIFC